MKPWDHPDDLLERITELEETVEWLGAMNSTLLDLRESVVLEEHQRAERAEADRDRYKDVLLSKHGGEPLALLDELDEARDELAALKAALEEVAKGEGRFSRDPLTHASNTIEDMKNIALAALHPPSFATRAEEGGGE